VPKAHLTQLAIQDLGSSSVSAMGHRIAQVDMAVPFAAEERARVRVGADQDTVEIKLHPRWVTDGGDVVPFPEPKGGRHVELGHHRLALDDEIEVAVVEAAGDVELALGIAEIEEPGVEPKAVPFDPALDGEFFVIKVI